MEINKAENAFENIVRTLNEKEKNLEHLLDIKFSLELYLLSNENAEPEIILDNRKIKNIYIEEYRDYERSKEYILKLLNLFGTGNISELEFLSSKKINFENASADFVRALVSENADLKKKDKEKAAYIKELNSYYEKFLTPTQKLHDIANVYLHLIQTCAPDRKITAELLATSSRNRHGKTKWYEILKTESFWKKVQELLVNFIKKMNNKISKENNEIKKQKLELDRTKLFERYAEVNKTLNNIETVNMERDKIQRDAKISKREKENFSKNKNASETNSDDRINPSDHMGSYSTNFIQPEADSDEDEESSFDKYRDNRFAPDKEE